MWIMDLFKKNRLVKKEDIPEFFKRPMPGRVVGVTSGKGGVGKTTISCSVASVLALHGKKTLVIDLDTGLRNMDILMNLSDKVTYNLYDVLEKKIPWQRAVIKVDKLDNLYILVSDHTREKEAIRKDAFEQLLFELVRYFDFIIIDCPAGIEYGFRLAVSCADEEIVVAGPDMPSLRGASQVIHLLYEKKPCVGVINRVIPKLREQGLCAGKQEAEEILGIPVVAEIPSDDAVVACAHLGVPIMLFDKKSPFKQAVTKFVTERYGLQG